MGHKDLSTNHLSLVERGYPIGGSPQNAFTLLLLERGLPIRSLSFDQATRSGKEILAPS